MLLQSRVRFLNCANLLRIQPVERFGTPAIQSDRDRYSAYSVQTGDFTLHINLAMDATAIICRGRCDDLYSCIACPLIFM
jgi:hypothetical protein